MYVRFDMSIKTILMLHSTDCAANVDRKTLRRSDSLDVGCKQASLADLELAMTAPRDARYEPWEGAF